MEAVFSGEAIRHWFHAFIAWLASDVVTPANIVYTTMQVPALVGSGFAAWWIYDFVHPVLEARSRRWSVQDLNERVLLTLGALIFPGLWSLGLLVAVAISSHFGWPNDILRIALNLILAWIAVQFLSIVVRNPIWSRVVAIVAYATAALNILHLLEPAVRLLDRLAITLGGLRISLLSVVGGALLLGILLRAAVLFSEMLEARVRGLPNLTPSVQVLFGKLLKASLVTLAVLVSLLSVGIDVTAIAVFGGALGVGLGFGLQKIVSNLISGVILLMDRSIKPGDIIQIGETYGWIAALGARYVSVETRDGTEFLIPNEDLITHQVVNWSHKDDLARLKVRVRVSYQSDVRKALELLVAAAGRPARVLKIPEPRALLLVFGESAMELELRFWIRDVQNGIKNISSEVMLEIWDLFREHGIEIPYPQQELHIRSLPSRSVATPGGGAVEPPGLAEAARPVLQSGE